MLETRTRSSAHLRTTTDRRRMEFGLFLQGYVPGPDAHDTDREHEAFMREVELVVTADRTNWKFAWFSEHHALTEYSHMSSSEVFMGYLAARTSRIHLGS